MASPGFGRPYSRDPYWFLFLRLLRCFSSAGSRPRTGTLELIRLQQEVPFGHPRFYGCMRLAGAYRSLPRPSSAPEPSHPPGGVRVPGPTWETYLVHLGKSPFQTRHARAIGTRRLNRSAEAFRLTPRAHQPRLLREPSSPATRCGRPPRAGETSPYGWRMAASFRVPFRA